MSLYDGFDHEQAEEKRRVRSRIGAAILEFCRLRCSADALDFHADDLRAFVLTKVAPVAPGSADRILRDMRQSGDLDYEITSRSKSLYRFIPRGTA